MLTLYQRIALCTPNPEGPWRQTAGCKYLPSYCLASAVIKLPCLPPQPRPTNCTLILLKHSAYSPHVSTQLASHSCSKLSSVSLPNDQHACTHICTFLLRCMLCPNCLLPPIYFNYQATPCKCPPYTSPKPITSCDASTILHAHQHQL